MARSFNTTGPCFPGKHYMLKPEDRCFGIMDLIEGENFFVIHAPRQSGKTTLLNTLEHDLNAGGKYHAMYCSLETVERIDDVEKGMIAIMACIYSSMRWHPGLKTYIGKELPSGPASSLLKDFLVELCSKLDRPLVVFFDEADCLGGDTLISFLRQLRDGYINRGRYKFVHSLALVGMRNIRDYKGQIRPDSTTLGTSSPFNIAKEARTITYFSRDDIRDLYQQHTDETGQVFPPDLVDKVFCLTQGQPWLVNAIAAEMVEKICGKDFRRPLNAAMADEAAQRIILRRDTHIDSLLDKLQEERVRKIIEPILCGEGDDIEELSDDFQYVCDLGLIRNDRGVLRIANPIYNEVIARTLNYNMQERLSPQLLRRWMDDASIDMSGLMKGFQEFWRDHSEAWRERFQYKEAAPHLILLAYLQRVVNGGAKIIREFATGTGRVDVCVEYGAKRYAIEMKLIRGPKTRGEGLEQLSAYMDTLGCKEGWLLLFDFKSQSPWEQKLTWETAAQDGRVIHIIGL